MLIPSIMRGLVEWGVACCAKVVLESDDGAGAVPVAAVVARRVVVAALVVEAALAVSPVDVLAAVVLGVCV